MNELLPKSVTEYVILECVLAILILPQFNNTPDTPVVIPEEDNTPVTPVVIPEEDNTPVTPVVIPDAEDNHVPVDSMDKAYESHRQIFADVLEEMVAEGYNMDLQDAKVFAEFKKRMNSSKINERLLEVTRSIYNSDPANISKVIEDLRHHTYNIGGDK